MLKCMFGGMTLCWSANEVLIKLARPAVPSVCPMTVLMEPT